MIKQLIFFVLFLFVLGACSQQKPDVISSDYITIEDVENILTEKGFKLERETDLSSQNVFIQELNRIKPEIYS